MAVVLISFALHPSGHLYLMLLTGSWGAGTSSECVMQKGGTTDENDEKKVDWPRVCLLNQRQAFITAISFKNKNTFHF